MHCVSWKMLAEKIELHYFSQFKESVPVRRMWERIQLRNNVENSKQVEGITFLSLFFTGTETIDTHCGFLSLHRAYTITRHTIKHGRDQLQWLWLCLQLHNAPSTQRRTRCSVKGLWHAVTSHFARTIKLLSLQDLLDSPKDCIVQLDHHFVSTSFARDPNASTYHSQFMPWAVIAFMCCCSCLLAWQRHFFTFTTIYAMAIIINALIKLSEKRETKKIRIAYLNDFMACNLFPSLCVVYIVRRVEWPALGSRWFLF